MLTVWFMITTNCLPASVRVYPDWTLWWSTPCQEMIHTVSCGRLWRCYWSCLIDSYSGVRLQYKQASWNWKPEQGVYCDYVTYVGGIEHDVTNKKLILTATAARQKYSAYLNELHVKEANDAKSKKRKALKEELEQLKTKKWRLQKMQKMQRLWRKKQMTLLQKQNRSMTSCALWSPTVCGKLWGRSWLTFRHLTCSWKVSSTSAGTIDTAAAIELLVHTVHSADSNWAVNIRKVLYLVQVVNKSRSSYWTC